MPGALIGVAGIVLATAPTRAHRLLGVLPSLLVIAVLATGLWIAASRALRKHDERAACRHPVQEAELTRILAEHQDSRAFGVSTRIPASELRDITKDRPSPDRWIGD